VGRLGLGLGLGLGSEKCSRGSVRVRIPSRGEDYPRGSIFYRGLSPGRELSPGVIS